MLANIERFSRSIRSIVLLGDRIHLRQTTFLSIEMLEICNDNRYRKGQGDDSNQSTSSTDYLAVYPSGHKITISHGRESGLKVGIVLSTVSYIELTSTNQKLAGIEVNFVFGSPCSAK